jgi:hypothetical protein
MLLVPVNSKQNEVRLRLLCGQPKSVWMRWPPMWKVQSSVIAGMTLLSAL